MQRAPGLALNTPAAEADGRDTEAPYPAGPHLFRCIQNIRNLTFTAWAFCAALPTEGYCPQQADLCWFFF